MATFKQYLQNRWYRGMSQDRAVAYPYQFQYGRNINVRNEKGAVMLASRPSLERLDISGDYKGLIKMQPCMTDTTYTLIYDDESDVCALNIVDTDLENAPIHIADFDDWNFAQNYDTPYGPWVVPFRDGVFAVNGQSQKIYFHPGLDEISPGEYGGEFAMSIVSAVGEPGVTYGADGHIHCVYNFADTFFLVAVGGILLRYQPLTNDVTNMANWKVIRYFGVKNTIVGLSQSGNYLKIYVTDGYKTQCHYAQGTFDLEESGMVQTIDYEGVLIEDCLVSDGTKDYGLFRTNIGIQLLEMDGYSYNVIRKTERRYVDVGTSSQSISPEYIFYDEDFKGAKLAWYDNTLYCALPNDGIWTFTKESVGSHGWVWGGVVEWGKENFGTGTIGKIQQITIQNGIMFVLVLNPYATIGSQDYTTLGIAEISNYPSTFTSSGYIIGNVYDGGCGSLFKKNVSTTLVCGNSRPRMGNTNGRITLGYRYDRANNSLLNFNYGTDWVKQIETAGIYDTIFITSTQQQVDGVLPEYINTTPRMFNKPWNTIEYVIKLETPFDPYSMIEDIRVSPILYEHNLIYEDSMRKYR